MCAPLGREHAKSCSKDLNLGILIWKRTIVQVHRESSTKRLEESLEDEKNRQVSVQAKRLDNLITYIDLCNKIMNLEKKGGRIYLHFIYNKIKI